MSNPYMEGASAKYRGKDFSRNPYPVDSPESKAWSRGYTQTFEMDDSGWFNFKEIKPEAGHTYIVWIVPRLSYYPSTPLETGFTGFARFNGSTWIHNNVTGEGDVVTHWMYKPAPPRS